MAVTTGNSRPARRAPQASRVIERAALTRSNISHEIIEVLRNEIATGALVKGARLPNERDLALQFGVSQPTIREAIRALDAMGLVQVRHGSGAYVVADTHGFVASSLQTLLQLEKVSILEVLEIRDVLADYSASRAVRYATEEEIARVQASLEMVEQETEVATIVGAVVTFQITFAAASHNPLLFAVEAFLVDLLMKFQLSVHGSRGRRFWRERVARTLDDRTRLVEALARRDEVGTVSALRGYLHNQRDMFASDPRLASKHLSEAEAVQPTTATVDHPDYAAAIRNRRTRSAHPA
jgi:GntR family transcriptional repressor for pyruvate dehydrogenase complex